MSRAALVASSSVPAGDSDGANPTPVSQFILDRDMDGQTILGELMFVISQPENVTPELINGGCKQIIDNLRQYGYHISIDRDGLTILHVLFDAMNNFPCVDQPLLPFITAAIGILTTQPSCTHSILNHVNHDGETALELAIGFNRLTDPPGLLDETILNLHRAGSNLNTDTTLHGIVQRRQVELLLKLLLQMTTNELKQIDCLNTPSKSVGLSLTQLTQVKPGNESFDEIEVKYSQPARLTSDIIRQLDEYHKQAAESISSSDSGGTSLTAPSPIEDLTNSFRMALRSIQATCHSKLLSSHHLTSLSRFQTELTLPRDSIDNAAADESLTDPADAALRAARFDRHWRAFLHIIDHTPNDIRIDETLFQQPRVTLLTVLLQTPHRLFIDLAQTNRLKWLRAKIHRLSGERAMIWEKKTTIDIILMQLATCRSSDVGDDADPDPPTLVSLLLTLLNSLLFQRRTLLDLDLSDPDFVPEPFIIGFQILEGSVERWFNMLTQQSCWSHRIRRSVLECFVQHEIYVDKKGQSFIHHLIQTLNTRQDGVECMKEYLRHEQHTDLWMPNLENGSTILDSAHSIEQISGNHSILDVIQSEVSIWREIHWPSIRSQLSDELLPDLADIIIQYLVDTKLTQMAIEPVRRGQKRTHNQTEIDQADNDVDEQPAEQ